MKRDRKKVFKGNLEQLTEEIVPHAIHEKWLQAKTTWLPQGSCKGEFCRAELGTQKNLFMERRYVLNTV